MMWQAGQTAWHAGAATAAGNVSLNWLGGNAGEIVSMFGHHIVLSGIPTLLGLLIALPIGALANRYRWAYTPTITIAGLFYTLPSLAVFVLLPLVLGTKILDPLNVIIALTIYTLALLVRVVADGLASVPDETIQAAEAMGYRTVRRFLTVDLPIAAPVILAGLRVASVANVSILSVAALLGIPQLGQLFTEGFQLDFYVPIIAGIVLTVFLAFVFDGIIVLAERLLTPWKRSRPEEVTA